MNWFCKWLWHSDKFLFSTGPWSIYMKCKRCGRYIKSYHPAGSDPLHLKWEPTTAVATFIAWTTYAIENEKYLKSCAEASKAAEERGRQWLISKQQS